MHGSCPREMGGPGFKKGIQNRSPKRGRAKVSLARLLRGREKRRLMNQETRV